MARVIAQGTTSVAANATVKNVLSGETYERLPYDADVFVGLAASATGLLVSYLIGGIGIAVNIAPSIINRAPQYPQDYPIRGQEGADGKQQILSAQNTTAGALSLFWIVEMEEL